MLARVLSAALVGVGAALVRVEVDVAVPLDQAVLGGNFLRALGALRGT